MNDNLNALEEWAGALLAKLSPGERRKLGNTIGRELRRNQQQRIASQRNPDGTPYASRKPRELRGKVGRIKRQMFARLRQAKHLRLQLTPATADAQRLRTLLQPFTPGNAPVRLRYRQASAECELLLGNAWQVNLDDELLEALNLWLKAENAVVVY